MKQRNIVMMIDDDQDTLTLYRLSMKEFEVSENFLTFGSATKALGYLTECAKADKPAPAYVIIDLNMPDMHGFQFIDNFEKALSSQLPETQIIISTSSVREIDKQKSKRYPSVVAFIPKPISRESLLALFQN